MTFGERIKRLRENEQLSQREVGLALGVSTRTIQAYEAGSTYPMVNALPAIADLFGVSIDSLMSEQDEFVAKAYEKGGSKGKREAEALIADAAGLFAGGRISEREKEAVFRALSEAYWIAKDEAKKYTPKKYRKGTAGGAEDGGAVVE